MPITGKTKFMVLNYPFHHYTVGWKQYYEGETEAFNFAIRDGYLDVVEDMLTKDPYIFRRIFLTRLTSGPIVEYPNANSLAVLAYLVNFYEVPDNFRLIDDQIMLRLKLSYYYAICCVGDMALFNAMKDTIIYSQHNGVYIIDMSNFAFTAAIRGGQLAILKLLYEDEYGDLSFYKSKYSTTSKLIKYNLREALENGKYEIVEYILERFQDAVSNFNKNKLLNYALRGGAPRVINFILKYTKLKFRIGQLPDVIMSNNVTIMVRFEKQFHDNFTKVLKKCNNYLIGDASADMMAFAIDHGFKIKLKVLLELANEKKDYSILNLAIQRYGSQDVLSTLASTYLDDDDDDMIPHFISYVTGLIEGYRKEN